MKITLVGIIIVLLSSMVAYGILIRVFGENTGGSIFIGAFVIMLSLYLLSKRSKP